MCPSCLAFSSGRFKQSRQGAGFRSRAKGRADGERAEGAQALPRSMLMRIFEQARLQIAPGCRALGGRRARLQRAPVGSFARLRRRPVARDAGLPAVRLAVDENEGGAAHDRASRDWSACLERIGPLSLPQPRQEIAAIPDQCRETPLLFSSSTGLGGNRPRPMTHRQARRLETDFAPPARSSVNRRQREFRDDLPAFQINNPSLREQGALR
jgi:hypothetical protein